jgi:hypothetical protein
MNERFVSLTCNNLPSLRVSVSCGRYFEFDKTCSIFVLFLNTNVSCENYV